MEARDNAQSPHDAPSPDDAIDDEGDPSDGDFSDD